jgi:hypothetical protein
MIFLQSIIKMEDPSCVICNRLTASCCCDGCRRYICFYCLSTIGHPYDQGDYCDTCVTSEREPPWNPEDWDWWLARESNYEEVLREISDRIRIDTIHMDKFLVSGIISRINNFINDAHILPQLTEIELDTMKVQMNSCESLIKEIHTRTTATKEEIHSLLWCVKFVVCCFSLKLDYLRESDEVDDNYLDVIDELLDLQRSYMILQTTLDQEYFQYI